MTRKARHWANAPTWQRRTGRLQAIALRLTLLATCLLFLQSPRASRADDPASYPAPPDDLFGELFIAVQLGKTFADQKSFVDAVPLRSPDEIMREYKRARTAPTFNLKAFVSTHFSLPAPAEEVVAPKGLALVDHIVWLWPQLTRSVASVRPGDSLLPLPHPYVVPGGRYQELYYWDSYFTMLGLAESGRADLVMSMLEDFAFEIERYGHIPNGSRSYQLSRSQPPYFSSMVELASQLKGAQVYTTYLRAMRSEHAFWMAGENTLEPGGAQRRVVKLPDGTLLNRYWDDRDTPRPESYADDVATAQAAPERPSSEVYRDLRAAAESGWDFSSRWLDDSQALSSIRTTAILPVDLNSLLHHLEVSIAKGCTAAHDQACVREFAARAKRRAAAIQRHLWHRAGYYADYDWQRGKARDNLTAAMASPLFSGVATAERARKTARALAPLVAPGGLLATAQRSGQQWDAPNGWAPLTWIAVAGLRRYGERTLAKTLGTRFLTRIKALYEREGKLVEKYNVQVGAAVGGGGGEYPLQDGFGWTNAVTLKLLALYDTPRPARPPASR